MELKDNTSNHYRYDARILKDIFLLIVMTTGMMGLTKGCSDPYNDSNEMQLMLAENIRTVSEQRSRAEEYLHILMASKYTTDVDLWAGRGLYINAKAKFDGWIDSFIAILHLKESPEQSAAFSSNLEQAVTASERFIEYVQRLDGSTVEKEAVPITSRTEQLAAQRDIIMALTNAGINIWKAGQEAKRQDRSDVLSKIEAALVAQKWKRISEVN